MKGLRRRVRSACVALVGAALLSSCGGSPSGPTPPPPPPPPTVTPPVISAVTAAVTRTEVDRDVAVTAAVEDAEKPISALTYVWTANAGTITGNGPSVTWRLAKGATQTPVDVVISLTVVEPYQALENGVLVNREHRVTRAAPAFRVHDSVDEISRMAVHFLVDLFGNSSLNADQALVDFWPACRGTAAERDDIVDNRAKRLITSVDARVDQVTLNGDLTAGEAVVACTFRDIILATGEPDTNTGTCRFDTVYHNSRWWLCSSSYDGTDEASVTKNRARSGRSVSGYWRSGLPDGVK